MPASSHETAKSVDHTAGSWFTPTRSFLLGAALYFLLSIVAFCIVKPATQMYFADYWEHRTIIAEVVRHGLNPVDPIYGEAATSRQYTPWSFILAYLARTTGMGVDNALTCGAMLVSLLFLFGVWDFARTYFRHPWAPAVFLAVLCSAWGLLPIMWTGFYGLRSQLHSNYYPASVVFALTFIAWAQVLRFMRAPRPNAVLAILLVLIVTFSVITHPLNAVPLVGGVVGLVALEPQVPITRRLIVLATMAAGTVLTIFWPYFNPLMLSSFGVAKGQDTFNNFTFFFRPVFLITQGWPALFALFFLKNQFGRPHFRLGAIAVVVTILVYVIGAISAISITHRLLAYVFLSMHIVLTRGLLDIIGEPEQDGAIQLDQALRRRCLIGVSLLTIWQVFMGIGQLVHPWSYAHPYPARDVAGETAKMATYLTRSAVPIGFDSAALVLPNYGIHVAAFPRPMVFSPTDQARQADYRRFFAAGAGVTTAERRAIAARWGVTHVVYLDFETKPALQRELARLGPVASPVGAWRVIVLKPVR